MGIDCHMVLVRLKHATARKEAEGASFSDAFKSSFAEFDQEIRLADAGQASKGYGSVLRFTSQVRSKSTLLQGPKLFGVDVALNLHRSILEMRRDGITASCDAFKQLKAEASLTAKRLRAAALA